MTSVSIQRPIVDMLSADSTEKHSLCDGLSGEYSMGLHVFAIFLILFVSLLGTAMPIMTKYIRVFRENPFIFTVGKTAATGVLLSVSTIHLIHEGAEAFAEPCIYDFFKDYAPFYFLFALIAVLMMQAIDLQLAEIAERWLKRQHDQESSTGSDVVIITEFGDEGGRATQVAGDERRALVLDDDAGAPLSPNSRGMQKAARRDTGESMAEVDGRSAAVLDRTDALASSHGHSHGRGEEENDAHVHQHLMVHIPRDMGSIRRVISAICMEFGVTLHSVFVGLAIGLTTDTELKPLLFALVFHQLFEGMAMGSRLVDASFEGHLETYLALIFSFSAPAGMTVATIAVSVSRDAMSGSGFVTMTAILDSFCGGILLYLAFTLLLGDFVADMKHYCADGLEGRFTRKMVLYGALWTGMGLMAFVGKWL